MNINFVSASVSRKSMGVFEVSRQLAIHLTRLNNRINVFGLTDQFTADDNARWMPVRPRTFTPAKPNALGYSRKYINDLLSTRADLAHLHVIWMYQSAMIYKWHKKFERPYITTVNGMLDPWIVNKSPWKKKVARALYENRALENCSCFHVNTMKELHTIRELGLNNPACIINNGVTIPDLDDVYNDPPWHGRVNPGKKVLLFLSRVHPKKGLVNLLKALAVLKERKEPGLKEWVLAIVGCREGGDHEAELQSIVQNNQLEEQVLFLNECFYEEMKACYFHCDAFILPSFSEGVPMAVLNAFAFGKFTLLTPECNLPEGYELGFTQRIETNIDSIAQGLGRLFNLNEAELIELGKRARAHAVETYSWDIMAKKMEEVYQWVGFGGSVPATVHFK